jgi:hypothetical protein
MDMLPGLSACLAGRERLHVLLDQDASDRFAFAHNLAPSNQDLLVLDRAIFLQIKKTDNLLSSHKLTN